MVQECGVGLVRVRRDGARLAFAAPPLRRSGPLDAPLLAQIARGAAPGAGDALRATSGSTTARAGVRCCWPARAAVLALRPDWAALGDLQARRGRRRMRPARDAQFEVRAFVPAVACPKTRSPAA